MSMGIGEKLNDSLSFNKMNEGIHVYFLTIMN